MLVSASSYVSLPHNPGVYQFLGSNHEVLYVGKAKNLRHRVGSYFTHQALHPKTKLLVSQIKKIRIIIVESEFESLLLEAAFIKKYVPKYNAKLTDDKAYPVIQITIKDKFPAILTARRITDTQSLYFGPYPDAKALRMVLRILRKIFPFHSTINHPKKICLYYHLGLCPCIPAFNTNESKDAYKKTLQHIRTFLEGNTKKVLADLAKERDAYSKEEKFEAAQQVQRQIDAIIIITHPRHKPVEYQTNPNLREDLRLEERKRLQIILNTYGVAVQSLDRIECYDISNFQGKQATASLVVFTHGEKDSSQYRRFKMNTSGPNDFAMMQEVLQRRLRHTEWDMPNLFIVDGGKGQISSAQKVLAENNILIPLVGLAKREEIIITTDFQEIKLSKKEPALKLIMRMRDEAHRFAITYHRKLRAKAFLGK